MSKMRKQLDRCSLSLFWVMKYVPYQREYLCSDLMSGFSKIRKQFVPIEGRNDHIVIHLVRPHILNSSSNESPDLPQDVIYHIFLQLPLIYLLSLRAVCKRWSEHLDTLSPFWEHRMYSLYGTTENYEDNWFILNVLMDSGPKVCGPVWSIRNSNFYPLSFLLSEIYNTCRNDEGYIEAYDPETNVKLYWIDLKTGKFHWKEKEYELVTFDRWDVHFPVVPTREYSLPPIDSEPTVTSWYFKRWISLPLRCLKNVFLCNCALFK